MTDLDDLPEPITSSRVTIPPSERARVLRMECQVAVYDARHDGRTPSEAILDVLAHANRDAVRELLNARREGIL